MYTGKLADLKVALIHDALTGPGGSVNVVRKLIAIFPDCHLYTSIDDNNIFLEDVRKKLVKKFTPIPFINKYGNFTKLLIRNYWEGLNLNSYDLVVSSSDEFSSKAVITKPQIPHISIIYTPTRFLYPENEVTRQGEVKSSLKKDLIRSFLRKHDFISASRPDVLVAISETVQKRIKKYYRRDSIIIYPPVSVPDKIPAKRKVDDYFIYIGTLDKRKGLNLAVKVFNGLKKKLVIVGDGPEKDNLLSLAGKYIKFTGYLPEVEKRSLLKKARAFVFPSINEDFGIAPVEALSYGVPVIAHKSGGLIETVREGKTGVFFEDFTENSMTKALLKFEKIKFIPAACHRSALRYSEDKFVSNFKSLVRKTLHNINGEPQPFRAGSKV